MCNTYFQVVHAFCVIFLAWPQPRVTLPYCLVNNPARYCEKWTVY